MSLTPSAILCAEYYSAMQACLIAKTTPCKFKIATNIHFYPEYCPQYTKVLDQIRDNGADVYIGATQHNFMVYVERQSSPPSTS